MFENVCLTELDISAVEEYYNIIIVIILYNIKHRLEICMCLCMIAWPSGPNRLATLL